MKILVKNWKDFQHYKDRSPPWIKLHKGLLDNYEYQCLPVASRALAPMLWLLASESDDGAIDHDIKKIAFRLRMTDREVSDALKPLIDGGFLVFDGDASTVLARCNSNAMPEAEVETEREIETEERERGAHSATRGTRLSSEWRCPDEWIADAIQIQPSWNAARAQCVADSFRDYWIGVPGVKGRKTDWRATWRNWVRKERGGINGKNGSSRADRISATIAELTGANRHPAPAIDGIAERVD